MTLQEIEAKLLKRFPNGFSKISEIPDPKLLKDIVKGAKRVKEAVKNNEKIVLIADYDVDGIISASITKLFFQEINFNIEVQFPNRFKNGYGISPELLKNIQADLIISADNGIHAFRSAKFLKKKNIDFIITDHHNPSDKIPDAFAVINPKQIDCPYPHKSICGAQVIWLFLAQIKRELNLKINMQKFIDLVSIAVIADLMPIKDLNHAIVKAGLQQFMKSNRIFNRIIKTHFLKGRNITSEDIAFQIAPRINSAGRLEDASISFQFITTNNYFEAETLFHEITSLNNKRKKIENDILEKVIASVDNSQNIIIYYDENIHEGVVGIVASKVVKLFQKPAFILSKKFNHLRGSGRGIGNIDIFQILNHSQDLFLKWGGHKSAGGLSMSIENLEEFRRKSIEFIEKNYTKDDFIEQFDSFGKLQPKDLTKELFVLLNKFEPFGFQHSKPIFFMENVKVVEVLTFGNGKKFQKIFVADEVKTVEVLIFIDNFQVFQKGEIISFYFQPHRSIFKGQEKIQALFENLKLN